MKFFNKIKLKFDPQLEEPFKNDYYNKSIVIARISMVLGIVLYAVFGILDHWIVPQSKFTVWFIRFAVVIPSLVIVLVFSFLKSYRKHMQWVQMLLALIVGLGIIMMVWIARPDELGRDFYFPGLFLVIIWTYTISRLRFVYASVASWFSTLAYIALLIFGQNALEGGMTGKTLPLLINNSFFFISENILGMFACYYLEYNMRINFLNIYNSEENNKQRMERLSGLIESSKKNLEKGEELIVSSGKTIEKISQIEISLKEITDFLDQLDKALQELMSINNQIMEDTGQTKSKIELENKIISQSGKAIEDISSSIQKVSSIALEKNKATGELLSVVNSGENEVMDSESSINNLSESTQDIFEIVTVIQNIASQTDLLSMNAAIEAAHAGDAGRGFSVVAEEIRKLAEQTADNTAEITAMIQKNVMDIQTSSDVNDKVVNNYNRISADINSIIEAMEQIFSDMNILQQRASEIISQVNSLYSTSQDVDRSMNQVNDLISDNNRKITELSGNFLIAKTKVLEISESFKLISSAARRINNIGSESMDQIQYLDKEIKKTEL